MCPCPDFNCASCLGLASPMDGTDKMEVEIDDEKKRNRGETPIEKHLYHNIIKSSL